MTDLLSPPVDLSKDITLQDGKGDVQIVWFVDYCDERTRMLRDIILRSQRLFGQDKLTIVVRMAPSADHADRQGLAARAAIAAHWQGKFEQFHAELFDKAPHLTLKTLEHLAKKHKLDADLFRADLDSARTQDKLSWDLASFSASPDMPMPALFIDGEPFDGPWDESAFLDAIEKPLGVRLHRAAQAFIHWAASAGLVLIAATIAALAVANFGGATWYDHLRHTEFSLTFGTWSLGLPLEVWINDGLMALFFLLVGTEIKREIVNGELSTLDKAALPIIGAIGGMLVPAGLYALINFGHPTAHGWGVPMATDIAFTLGLLALLGSRVPTSLKIFVSALAIADDMGAILVIALFYGHGFHLDALLWAGAIFGLMMLLNLGRIYHRTPYILLLVVLWFFVLQSGLHATLAGVLTAAAIPSRRSAHIEAVALHATAVLDANKNVAEGQIDDRSFNRLRESFDRLREPGFHLQHALESWSSFLILPLFAFFNTGLVLIGTHFDLMAPEVAGTVLGLVLGKPLGIALSVFLAVRFGWAKLSSEISWLQLVGASCLAGIGFTMSIFIASAAFEGDQLNAVKLAVLLASALSAAIGTCLLLMSRPSTARPQTAPQNQQPQKVRIRLSK